MEYLNKKLEHIVRESTYDAPALIQVISAEFMFKSAPMDAVTPTIHPWKKDCWPIAIVAVKTNRHS